jgi:colanic acid/amylovoran biosynthesis glycosyltransferase
MQFDFGLWLKPVKAWLRQTMFEGAKTGVRLAYLCNQYPAVSHSFIRREIAAIEQLGHDVVRISIRNAGAGLRDQADLEEASRTFFVLQQGLFLLIWASVRLALARPLKFWRAAALALRMAGTSPAVLIRHVAYLAEASLLVRHLERAGVVHIHAHFGTNPAAVARIIKRLGGPPYSFTVHGPDEFDAPRGLHLRGKIADAHFVAAISHYGRAQLMRWSEPEHWDKIGIVRCGVDDGFLRTPEVPVPDVPHFCCVARLSPQKGLPVLIETVEILKKRGLEFKITVIGDGEMRPHLEAQIRERGLGPYLRLVGARSGSEIRSHLLDARAFVLPSFAEGLPVVIMEALAVGRPVITTVIAGTPELVGEDCGWLVPAGSPETLAEAMVDALRTKPDVLSAMGRRGRAKVAASHDVKRNAIALASLMTGSPPRQPSHRRPSSP